MLTTYSGCWLHRKAVSCSMDTQHLAKEIVRLLDVKARQGVRKPEQTWIGSENGEGVEIGTEIERLIQKAKVVIKASGNEK